MSGIKVYFKLKDYSISPSLYAEGKSAITKTECLKKNKTNENSSSRRWIESETNLLVGLVKKHYDFLTSACNPKKTRKIFENKWAEITEAVKAVNALGGATTKLTCEQIKKKNCHI